MPSKKLKSDRPKLSIITVCLNDCDRLIKTINSVSDNYNDARFEHIVIDGGSVDRTTDTVNNFSGFENFKFYSKPDDGIYDGMNRGLAAASGDWILFLNCGDVLSMRFDEILASLGRFDHGLSRYVLCFNYATEFQGNVWTHKANPLTKIKLPTSHQAMIFLRDWLIQHPYDAGMKIAADFDAYSKVDSERVWFNLFGDVLTTVELKGFAFSQPTLSYYECLVVIWRNNTGVERITRAGFLIAKYFVVTILKALLSENMYFKLRAGLL